MSHLKATAAIIGIILVLAIFASGCTQSQTTPATPVPTTKPATTAAPTPAKPVVTAASNATQAGIPNPASVNCEEKGGKVDIRKNPDGSEYGVCVFPNGSECDEWALFRGECSPKTNVTANATASNVTAIKTPAANLTASNTTAANMTAVNTTVANTTAKK